MINPWGLKSAPVPYHIVEQQQRHLSEVSVMHSDAWEAHLSHLSGRINKHLRSLIRMNFAHAEATCFPFGSLSWSMDSSTDWVSVYMLEMNNPKVKFLYFINEVSLYTTYISFE